MASAAIVPEMPGLPDEAEDWLMLHLESFRSRQAEQHT